MTKCNKAIDSLLRELFYTPTVEQLQESELAPDREIEAFHDRGCSVCVYNKSDSGSWRSCQSCVAGSNFQLYKGPAHADLFMVVK